MAFITVIEDDRQREIARLVTTHEKYVLPDGTESFIHADPAWCRCCGKFSLVEALRSPEEMERSAREFHAHRMASPLLPPDLFPPERSAEMARSLLAKFLHEAEQWRRALVVRQSAPRCLECGGTEFVKVPSEGWLQHPAVPDTRVRVQPNYIHASMCSMGRLYDTEGRRLQDRYAAP